jgi:hypothetical protein
LGFTSFTGGAQNNLPKMSKLLNTLCFVSALILLIVFSSRLVEAKAEVYNEVHTEAQGSSASVHSEITTVVNGEEAKVVSDQPGEIRVEVNDGDVQIESEPEVTPTVIISESTAADQQKAEIKKEKPEAFSRLTRVQSTIISFFENLFSRLKYLTNWPK